MKSLILALLLTSPVIAQQSFRFDSGWVDAKKISEIQDGVQSPVNLAVWLPAATENCTRYEIQPLIEYSYDAHFENLTNEPLTFDGSYSCIHWLTQNTFESLDLLTIFAVQSGGGIGPGQVGALAAADGFPGGPDEGGYHVNRNDVALPTVILPGWQMDLLKRGRNGLHRFYYNPQYYYFISNINGNTNAGLGWSAHNPYVKTTYLNNVARISGYVTIYE